MSEKQNPLVDETTQPHPSPAARLDPIYVAPVTDPNATEETQYGQSHSLTDSRFSELDDRTCQLSEAIADIWRSLTSIKRILADNAEALRLLAHAPNLNPEVDNESDPAVARLATPYINGDPAAPAAESPSEPPPAV